MSFLGLATRRGPALVDAATGRAIDAAELLENGRASVAPLGGAKDLLFLFCDQSPFTACAYAGALHAGHVVAMLDAAGRPEAAAALAGCYRPAWVAGPPGTAAALEAHGVALRPVLAAHGGELSRTSHPSHAALHPDLALLLPTSGTTGSKKLVRLSRRNLESNASAIAGYLGLSPDERPMASLPLHYSFGLSVLNSHWAAGAPVVLSRESPVQEAFWSEIHARACTSFAGVPFSYQMLERAGFRSRSLPALRTLQQAGGALDKRLAALYGEHMQRRGGRLFVMYGQTEATARISYVPPDRLMEKLGSAGIPIEGGRWRIEPTSAEERARGIGEVVYEGPNVMMGYASTPEDLAKGDEKGGTLYTGDIGRLDDDGFLFLVGRSKRIAKVFGARINLDEVEARLAEAGPVAVVAGEDCIWAFFASGTDAAVEETRMRMARELSIHHGALRFQRVDGIPTTSTGKTDYQKVQRWAAG